MLCRVCVNITHICPHYFYDYCYYNRAADETKKTCTKQHKHKCTSVAKAFRSARCGTSIEYNSAGTLSCITKCYKLTKQAVALCSRARCLGGGARLDLHRSQRTWVFCVACVCVCVPVSTGLQSCVLELCCDHAVIIIIHCSNMCAPNAARQ